MRQTKLIGLLILAVFVGSAILIASLRMTTPQKSIRLMIAEDEAAINWTYFELKAGQTLYIVVPSALVLSGLVFVSCFSLAKVRRASVHTYKIGKYNEIVVLHKDLSLAAPVAMGLINAEQLKQENAGLEKAMELYKTIADVQISQTRALGFQQRAALPEHHDEPDEPAKPVPTFQQLLLSGEIAPGKPMILGYEHGKPRTGSFLDIYSAAVAGESGSGKTATLLYLIGSGLITEKIRFYGIDPHYPHPKSLGFKTKVLWQSGLMQMATNKDDSLKVLKEVEKIITERLQQIDTDTTPVVLVIDELAFLSKTALGKSLAYTMERISTEGRKCAVYMLASSQTWLVARTGENSVVRDTLTSAYVHRIKPKQANLLLQDREEVEKVKRYCKRAGDVLLCPVNDESVLCKIPYTTETDMQTLLSMFGLFLHSSDIDGMFQQMSRGAESANLQEGKELSIRQIEKQTGIPYSALQRYYSENKPLKPEYQMKLDKYLFKMNQAESVLKSIESEHESSLNHAALIQ